MTTPMPMTMKDVFRVYNYEQLFSPRSQVAIYIKGERRVRFMEFPLTVDP